MSGSGNRNYPLLLTRAPGPFGYDDQYFQKGTLHSVGLVASEQISAPFELIVTADSTETVSDPNVLLRKPMGITVRRSAGSGGLKPDRYFHGIIRGIKYLGITNTARADQGELSARFRYELTLVPRLWLMELRTDCRIFQNKTTVQILTLLFEESGVKPFEFRAKGGRTVRKYVTQYNETNLQFAQRLMQEAGLYYFFKHAENDHTLVVADGNEQFETMPRPKHKTVAVGNNEDIVSRWEASFRTTHQQSNLADYDLRAPTTPIKGRKQVRGTLARQSEGATYHWPAYTPENGVAEQRTGYQMEAAEAQAIEYAGTSTDPHFCPGSIFELGSGVEAAESAQYVVRSAVFTARDETWIAGAGQAYYGTEFTCFPKSAVWREPVLIPKPVMTGVFSAIVVGTGGEIDTDKYGRIKVRPLFDAKRPLDGAPAQGEFNPGSDIWVRVLHPWTGAQQGAARGWQHIPRIDTEVGLSFMNGDPDDPVVLGCFYNNDAMPPFSLPAEKTRQGYRSHSSADRSSGDYNELSFEDKAGEEEVYIRAQKNHVVDVMHDRTVTTVRHDTLESRTGNISITADNGSVTIEARTRITLRVGTSSIEITPMGVNIMTPGEYGCLAGTIAITAEAAMGINSGAAMTVNSGAALLMDAGANVSVNASTILLDSPVPVLAPDGVVIP
ncbi:MAG: type VI secretion system tip protein VgrG [Gluconacetobacter diazotrophicus]|nr:type VI secretion system tip protein VgrG [Gluconacetobacter diazotrophicus]